MRPHSYDVLAACLERLLEANKDWCQAAAAHHELLIASRLEAAATTMEAMERALLRIGDEESLRVEESIVLADELGIASEPPPRLEVLCAALPEELGRKLSESGTKLRASLAEAQTLASRIRVIAEIGWKTTEATVSAAKTLATRSARPPAAYVRGGRRTSGTAVPVYDRSWRA